MGRLATIPPITEAEFQRQVIDLAHIYHWLVYHPMLSKWSERGWPDLSMVRGDRMIFAELKREKGVLTKDQVKWLVLLEHTCAEVYVWRPSNIEQIAEVLK
jgi:hypothetical protein